MTRVHRARRPAPALHSKLLLVTSSPQGPEAAPLLVARRLAEGLVATHPGQALVVRDLDRPPQFPTAAADSATSRAAAMARGGAYLDELFDAEVVVLAAGVTRRSLSASLKAWFERVMVPGLTFAYRDGRVDGLLRGKKVYLVFGVDDEAPGPAAPEDDFHEEYLRLMLKIMGLTDVEVIRTDEVEPAAAAWDRVAVILEQSL